MVSIATAKENSYSWVRSVQNMCEINDTCEYSNLTVENLWVTGELINTTVTDYNITGDVAATGNVYIGGNESINDTFLRLDTQNDPLTGDLEIRKTDPLIYLNTGDSLESQFRIYNDDGTLALDRVLLGTPNNVMRYGIDGVWRWQDVAGFGGMSFASQQSLAFRNSGQYIYSPSSGQLDIRASTLLNLAPDGSTRTSALNVRNSGIAFNVTNLPGSTTMFYVNSGAPNIVSEVQTFIDLTGTRALVARKNNAGGDVFVIDTVNNRVNVSGDLYTNQTVGNNTHRYTWADLNNSYNEYPHDQNLNTTDNVTFNNITATGDVMIDGVSTFTNSQTNFTNAAPRVGIGTAGFTTLHLDYPSGGGILQTNIAGTPSLQVISSPTAAVFNGQGGQLVFNSNAGDVQFATFYSKANITFTSSSGGINLYSAGSNPLRVSIAAPLQFVSYSGFPRNASMKWQHNISTVDSNIMANYTISNASNAQVVIIEQPGNLHITGNLNVGGNINVSGCVDYNGGVLGTCV